MIESDESREQLAEGQEARGGVGWFELFYDLVVVAAVGQSTHIFGAHPSWGMSGWIAVSLIALFALWLLTTLNHDIYPGDSPVRRLLILIQMLSLVTAALAMGRRGGLPDPIGFVALAGAFASIAVMYALSARQHPDPDHRRSAHLITASTGIGALVLLTATPIPEDAVGWEANPAPWILALGLAIAVLPMLTVFLSRVTRRGILNEEHLGERMGQLILIVLGESFISLVATLGTEPHIPNPVFFVLTFVVIFAIWTVYFSSVLPMGVPHRVGLLRVWLASHWLLMYGAIATATAFSALTLVPIADVGPGVSGRWTPAPLLAVMGAITILTWLPGRQITPLVRLHLGATLVLLVLAVIAVAFLGEQALWATAAGALVVVIDAAVSAGIVRGSQRSSLVPV